MRLLAGLLMACVCSGCQDEKSPMEQPDVVAEFSDSRTALEILDSTKARYEGATSYQDQAVLYLTYRLNGRAIQEPHPWSIAWRETGEFAADWFNARIRSDGERFSCYIYDIETGNVDNQQIWLPASGHAQVRQLFDDDIARHFLCGTSELPLDELESEHENLLVQPLLGFCDPAMAVDWLAAPQQIERLEDDDSTGEVCYVLKIVHDRKLYRLWINQPTGLIQQIELPLHYLDSDILASTEVTDLHFVVRMHGAAINAEIPVGKFEAKQALAARPVSRFVPLPEPMAAAKIGQQVPTHEFLTPQGDPLTSDEMADGLHVMFFVTGFGAEKQVKQLAELKRELGSADLRWSIVYGDELLKLPGSHSFEMADEYRMNFESSGLRLLYDREMRVSTLFELKVVPSVVVLDTDGILQYARAVDTERWLEHLKTAVERIRQGEAIGSEMRAEYENFLNEYHDRLLAASVNMGRERNSNVDQDPMTARLAWRTEALQDPGNIHVDRRTGRILVVDGWQTVVSLNPDGKMARSHRLPLPAGAAINRIRSWHGTENRALFAVFGLLGKQVHVFDEQWNLILQVPEQVTTGKYHGVTECQFADFDGDGKPELWLSFVDTPGLQRFDLENGASTTITTEPIRSFWVTESAVFRVQNDSLICSDPRYDLGQLKGYQIKRLRGNETHVFAVGRDDRNQWTMFGLRLDDGTVWSQPIGNQLFETEIEPLAIAGTGARQLVVSASPQRVMLLNSLGHRLTTVSTTANGIEELAGVNLWQRPNGFSLLLAADGQVSMWNLDAADSETPPLSRKEDSAEIPPTRVGPPTGSAVVPAGQAPR